MHEIYTEIYTEQNLKKNTKVLTIGKWFLEKRKKQNVRLTIFLV